MSDAILEKLRSEVLGLPDGDRAHLAHDLIRSLDSSPDPGAADAWDLEIMRRLATIDAGTAQYVDRDEMRRRMRERSGVI